MQLSCLSQTSLEDGLIIIRHQEHKTIDWSFVKSSFSTASFVVNKKPLAHDLKWSFLYRFLSIFYLGEQISSRLIRPLWKFIQKATYITRITTQVLIFLTIKKIVFSNNQLIAGNNLYQFNIHDLYVFYMVKIVWPKSYWSYYQLQTWHRCDVVKFSTVECVLLKILSL